MANKLTIPLRLKIVILIGAALVVSLMAYLYVGTSLIVEDKVSYIYDYTLGEVKTASVRLESQINKMITTTRVMSNVTRRSGENLKTQEIYFDVSKDIGVSGMVILRPKGSAFRVIFSIDKGRKLWEHSAKELVWTPEIFKKKEVWVGRTVNGVVPVGIKMSDERGRPLIYTYFAKLDINLTNQTSGFSIFLLNALGDTIVANESGEEKFTDERIAEFTQLISTRTFESGVREWQDKSKNNYILSYQKLALGHLIVAGVISKAAAFDAAKALLLRSIALGVSILLVALGMTLLFVKRLTRALRDMWQATKKVAQGDFSGRVDVGNRNDEVGGLALSFNTMAEKITELMEQTAHKARMEKELETAQTVQSSFFPKEDFDSPQICLSGKSFAASQCGGDWWFYTQHENYLAIIIGDVMGHGVSAALSTAAAYGAYTIETQSFEKGKKPSISKIVQTLNAAIFAASNGSSSMSFFGGVVDLTTGKMDVINASHRPPMVLREGQLVPIMEGQTLGLGLGKDLTVKAGEFQLKKGDQFFLYTDGLIESHVEGVSDMRKPVLARIIKKAMEGNAGKVNETCKQIVADSLGHLKTSVEKLEDDVTVIVGYVHDFSAVEVKPRSEVHQSDAA